MRAVIHQIDGVATLQALPLAAGLLVASARSQPELAARVRFDLRSERAAPDAAVDDLASADVLAFSTYVWNERYSLELARRAKARQPAAFVLFGGPSIPRKPARAAEYLRAHPFIDALAFGEGEVVFGELLAVLAADRPLDAVPGLALARRASPEGAVLTAPRDRIAEFERTASPYLDGTFDALLHAGARPNAAIVETNRGCPFACTFCDWGQAIQSRVRELPRERLERELDWISEHGIPYLYIVDANFGIRKRDLAIVEGIAARHVREQSPKYVFFHLTKNATERHLALVTALKNSGVGTHLALSAQDFEPRVLAAVRRDNIRLDRALDLRRACDDAGIPTLNELILGLPEQTYASFTESMVRAVTPYPLDTFNLYLARLLENSEMAERTERAKYGVESRWVNVASFHHVQPEHVRELEEVVVATRALPIADWKRAHAFGYLLSALHNLQLLHVPLQVVWRSKTIDPRRFVEQLLERLESGSELGRALERYADAVLAGRAMALPHPRTDERLWPVEDAVLLEVLLDPDGFFGAVADLVARVFPEHAVLREATRFQALVTPAFGGAAERRAELSIDVERWLSGRTAGIERRTQYTWRLDPALAAAPSLEELAVHYLARVHARAPTGHLVREPA